MTDTVDVEACVRLLPIIAAWHKAAVHGVPESKLRDFHEGVIAMADALASALPGMGKALAIADEWFGCCDCITTEFGTDERKKQYWALRRAARAAQPEETSAECDAIHAEMGARCELPLGHEGQHAAFRNEYDERGSIPELRWYTADAEGGRTHG